MKFRFNVNVEEGGLRRMFMGKLTERGMELMMGLLAYDPERRWTASRALDHTYFK